MFSNIFSLAWHIKNNLFVYLICLFLSFPLFLSAYPFSLLFHPLYLLTHFGFSSSSFASISFRSSFSLNSLAFPFFLLASFLLDLIFVLFFLYGQGSSVGIATDYVLDGPGSNLSGDEIFRPTRPAMGPTKPPVKWVPGLSRV